MKRIVLVVVLATFASMSIAAEKSITIPTDARATYTILQIDGTWPSRTIVTKRVGASGTTYSKRLYNCSNSTVKYLGTGDTPAEMARSKADSNIAPIVDQSIADYVGRHACKR